MATNFAELRKNRGKNIDKLTNKLNEMSSGGYSNPDDDKYWSPTLDPAGNGSATIRFLQAPKGEDIPFVERWSHGFKGPTGKWYIENCLTTLKQTDPVVEACGVLWNSGREEDKETVRERKRKHSFYSNILVVDDPAKPENNGKVFYYRYGKKIFDMIQDMIKPEFEEDTPVDVFDFWEGANFRLRVRKVSGYPNYDKSSFDKKTSAIADDDEEIQKIWDMEYSLQDIVDPKNFKSYAELKAKYHAVLGYDADSSIADRADKGSSDDEENLLANDGDEDDDRQTSKAKDQLVDKAPLEVDDDEDELAEFRRLVSED